MEARGITKRPVNENFNDQCLELLYKSMSKCSVCFDVMYIRRYVGMNEAEAEILQADLPSFFGGGYGSRASGMRSNLSC